MMVVDAEDEVVAERLPRPAEHPGCRADRLARLEDLATALTDREEADRLPTLCG